MVLPRAPQTGAPAAVNLSTGSNTSNNTTSACGARVVSASSAEQRSAAQSRKRTATSEWRAAKSGASVSPSVGATATTAASGGSPTL